jgi:hypothetical protein
MLDIDDTPIDGAFHQSLVGSGLQYEAGWRPS